MPCNNDIELTKIDCLENMHSNKEVCKIRISFWQIFLVALVGRSKILQISTYGNRFYCFLHSLTHALGTHDKLPSLKPGRYMADIFNVVIKYVGI